MGSSSNTMSSSSAPWTRKTSRIAIWASVAFIIPFAFFQCAVSTMRILTVSYETNEIILSTTDLTTATTSRSLRAPTATTDNVRSRSDLEEKNDSDVESEYVEEEEEETPPTIRSWGCNLVETPLIFVHIGKAGGGTVRARFAASAQNFNPRQRWQELKDAYYPVGGDDNPDERGYFCTSGHMNFRSHGENTMEKTQFCHATTPIGHAIACPEPMAWKKDKSSQCRKACALDSDTCHTVYAGHNLLGSEMHWLPQRYLSNWWDDYYYNNDDTDEEDGNNKIKSFLKTLAPNHTDWCPYKSGLSRPNTTTEEESEYYAHCSAALGQAVDKEAYVAQQTKKMPGSSLVQHPDDMDWSPIYASLPLLRTTMVREPFSWLASKFLWHGGLRKKSLKCDDISQATLFPKEDNPFRADTRKVKMGWADRFALNYILYLCGEDCASRYFQGIGSIEQMERQAANNLRHSFAVVGLLNETQTFFDMVTQRVQYVNMSLNPQVKGASHATGNKAGEQKRCKAVMADPDWQARLVEASPMVAALDRLYRLAVQVNRFQQEELKQCSISSNSAATAGVAASGDDTTTAAGDTTSLSSVQQETATTAR